MTTKTPEQDDGKEKKNLTSYLSKLRAEKKETRVKTDSSWILDKKKKDKDKDKEREKDKEKDKQKKDKLGKKDELKAEETRSSSKDLPALTSNTARAVSSHQLRSSDSFQKEEGDASTGSLRMKKPSRSSVPEFSPKSSPVPIRVRKDENVVGRSSWNEAFLRPNMRKDSSSNLASPNQATLSSTSSESLPEAPEHSSPLSRTRVPLFSPRVQIVESPTTKSSLAKFLEFTQNQKFPHKFTTLKRSNTDGYFNTWDYPVDPGLGEEWDDEESDRSSIRQRSHTVISPPPQPKEHEDDLDIVDSKVSQQEREETLQAYKKFAKSLEQSLEKHSGGSLMDEEEEKEASWGEFDGKKCIVAGTLKQLIKLFAGIEVADNEYISTFLITHNYFIDPVIMFDEMLQRYQVEPPPKADSNTLAEFSRLRMMIRLRLIKVLRVWIKNEFLAFKESPDLMSKLGTFLSIMTSEAEKPWAKLLSDTIKQRAHGRKVDPSEMPPPYVPKSNSSLLDFHPVEVARQLTLIDHLQFKKLRQKELSHCAWMKKDGVQAPHVMEIIDRFNKVNLWVATEILTTANNSQRVAVLGKLIHIASTLQTLNNFHTLFAFFAGLSMGPVRKLTSTWKDLPDKYQKKVKALEELFSTAQNKKNYRESFKNCKPPQIPQLAVCLSDLCQFEESPDYLESGLINFGKMRSLAKVFKQIEICQSNDYAFAQVPKIFDFFQTNKLIFKSEKELYNIYKTTTSTETHKDHSNSKFQFLKKKK